MYPLPKHSMAGRLTPAWAFLTGQERQFEEGQLHELRAGDHEHAIVLPVRMPHRVDPSLMAVSLLIGDREARTVACFMFGLSEGDLQPDDVRDACMEACNVLGACLVRHDTMTGEVEIGLPKELPMHQFISLRQHAHECVTFQSHDPGGQGVVLTVFEAIQANSGVLT